MILYILANCHYLKLRTFQFCSNRGEKSLKLVYHFLTGEIFYKLRLIHLSGVTNLIVYLFIRVKIGKKNSIQIIQKRIWISFNRFKNQNPLLQADSKIISYRSSKLSNAALGKKIGWRAVLRKPYICGRLLHLDFLIHHRFITKD